MRRPSKITHRAWDDFHPDIQADLVDELSYGKYLGTVSAVPAITGYQMNAIGPGEISGSLGLVIVACKIFIYQREKRIFQSEGTR